jgi:hypothetical protein
VTPIGYRAAQSSEDPLALNGGIRINPPKDTAVDFLAGDALVVISQN